LVGVGEDLSALLQDDRPSYDVLLLLEAALLEFERCRILGDDTDLRLVETLGCHRLDHLLALAAGGLVGFGGNWLAAIIRTRAGNQLDSPALIADGNHARADSYVSLAVVASAIVVALGLPIADPLIGLGITVVIIKITWDSWWTVRSHDHAH